MGVTFLARLAGLAMVIAGLAGAAYAETIKVGVIGPFSGPFALQGKNFKAGIDAYMAMNGDTVGDDTVEIVYRDLPQADPAQSKALAQELVVKEGVQYLAGFYFTPDAMAVTPLLEQANVPMVVMNAATSAIVTKSPLVVRTSFTIWQTLTPMAKVAAEAGVKKVITVVSDYGPGHDAETAFKAGFREAGRHGRRDDPHAAGDQRLQPDHAAHQGFRRGSGVRLPAVRSDDARLRQGI